jgi:hypothetical protein
MSDEEFSDVQIDNYKKVLLDESSLELTYQELRDSAKLPVCKSLIRSLTREKQKETVNEQLRQKIEDINEKNRNLEIKITNLEEYARQQVKALLENGEILHNYKQSIQRLIIEFNNSTDHNLTWDITEHDFSAYPDERHAIKFQYLSLRTIEMWIRNSVFQLNEVENCQKVVQKTLVAGFGIKEAP